MPLLAPSSPSATPNPADDAVVAQWRMYFLQQVKAIGDESADERVRLAASIGGLRALAQIQTIHQRERRLQQHERGLELAAQHLAIQQQRAGREAHREDYEQAAVEAADAAAQSSTDANPPLRHDEIADIKSKLGIHSETLNNPRMANYFRGLLRTDNYWKAYWIGYNQATAIIKGGGSIKETDLTKDPTPHPLATPTPASPSASSSNTKPAPTPSAKPAPAPEPAAPSPPAPACSEPAPAPPPPAAKISLGNLVHPQSYLKALPAPPLKPASNDLVIAAQSAALPEASPNARDPPRPMLR